MSQRSFQKNSDDGQIICSISKIHKQFPISPHFQNHIGQTSHFTKPYAQDDSKNQKLQTKQTNQRCQSSNLHAISNQTQHERIVRLNNKISEFTAQLHRNQQKQNIQSNQRVSFLSESKNTLKIIYVKQGKKYQICIVGLSKYIFQQIVNSLDLEKYQQVKPFQ